MSLPRIATPCEKRVTCTLTDAIEAVVDEFSLCHDWDERYELLIEMGNELPGLPEELQVEENQVEGCMSTVWMVAEYHPGDPPAITIEADSDSLIVRGLIAVLLSVYSGRSPQEILGCDIHCLFERLELDKHLSTQRRNGLNAMIKRVHALAAAHAD